MTSRIEQRLRKLEAETSGPPLVRIVWSDTSDEAEWECRIADMIDSGRARAVDDFMRIGWMRPSVAQKKAASNTRPNPDRTMA